MTRRDSFDAALAEWLEDEATGTTPASLHDDAIRAARVVRQRPLLLVMVRGGVDFGPRLGIRRPVATRFVLVILALALLVAALALVGVGGPRPIVNGRILLARETTAPKAEYFTIRPDGTDEVKFLEASECGQCTFWSPDGRRIMMPKVIDGRLRTAVIAPDGTGEVVLAFPGETLFLGPGDWSPDGRQLALQGFDPSDASRAGIFITASDGSSIKRHGTLEIEVETRRDRRRRRPLGNGRGSGIASRGAGGQLADRQRAAESGLCRTGLAGRLQRRRRRRPRRPL